MPRYAFHLHVSDSRRGRGNHYVHAYLQTPTIHFTFVSLNILCVSRWASFLQHALRARSPSPSPLKRLPPGDKASIAATGNVFQRRTFLTIQSMPYDRYAQQAHGLPGGIKISGASMSHGTYAQYLQHVLRLSAPRCSIYRDTEWGGFDDHAQMLIRRCSMR